MATVIHAWVDIAGVSVEVEITNIAPPIPMNDFDWQARRTGDDDEEPVRGFGSTSEAALADLVAQLSDDLLDDFNYAGSRHHY